MKSTRSTIGWSTLPLRLMSSFPSKTLPFSLPKLSPSMLAIGHIAPRGVGVATRGGMSMVLSALLQHSRRAHWVPYLRLTRSLVVPSKLLSVPRPTSPSPHSSSINGGLTYDQIERFKSVRDVLTAWHRQHKTVTPDITLKCLIEVTNLIRLSKDYGYLSSSGFKQLLQASVNTASSLGPERVVTLLWVIAKIKWANFEAIKKLVSIVQKDLSRLSDKAVGLIPWALVTLKTGETYELLLSRIVKEVCLRLERGEFRDARALANICWALSRTKRWPTHFTPHVEGFLRTQGRGMSPHTLSMFLHAMSRSGVLRSEEWLFSIVRNSVHQLKNTDTQSLILILWSIGNQKAYDKGLFERLEREVLSGELVQQYTPRVLATLIWCCARAQYYSEGLLEHLAEQVPHFVDKMTLQDMGMVAYSFAYLNYSCPDLLRTIASRVLLLNESRPVCFQVLLNLSWACLINEVYPRALFDLCMSRKIIERKFINHLFLLRLLP